MKMAITFPQFQDLILLSSSKSSFSLQAFNLSIKALQSAGCLVMKKKYLLKINIYHFKIITHHF